MKKINKVKSVLCILVALALIIPRLGYGNEENKSNSDREGADVLMAGNVLAISATVWAAGWYQITDPIIEDEWTPKKQRVAYIKGIALHVLAYWGVAFSAVVLAGHALGADAELTYLKATGYLYNIDEELSERDGIVRFKGTEERKLQLNGKRLDASYNLVNKTCAFDTPELTLYTPRGISDVKTKREMNRTVKTYIAMGCPSEFYKPQTADDVNYLHNYGVISDIAANTAKDAFKDPNRDTSYPVAIPPISSADNGRVIYIQKKGS